MQKSKFNVVTDGMYGSTGKGLIASALAWKYKPEILSTTNMANAGHSAVWTDGTVFVAKAIPSPAILTKWMLGYQPHIVVGATAAFNLERLIEEMKTCGVTYSTHIHPRAGVITEAHRAAEAGNSESSTKHLASTMQGCGTFLADKILRKPTVKLSRDYPELAGYMAEHMVSRLPIAFDSELAKQPLHIILHHLMLKHNYTILHEGSQGYSLDISHGQSYPTCTSRGTTAVQNLADMGIQPQMLGDTYLVIRPYAIRVGNVIEDGKQVGYSGDCYSDQHEMTWEQVAKEAGMPEGEAKLLTTKELTTVTKRLRRVYSWSDQQLKEAVITNGATKIALNFANYVDWQVSKKNQWSDMTIKVKDFIKKVEDIAGIPVTMVGTGPQIDHVVFI